MEELMQLSSGIFWGVLISILIASCMIKTAPSRKQPQIVMCKMTLTDNVGVIHELVRTCEII